MASSEWALITPSSSIGRRPAPEWYTMLNSCPCPVLDHAQCTCNNLDSRPATIMTASQQLSRNRIKGYVYVAYHSSLYYHFVDVKIVILEGQKGFNENNEIAQVRLTSPFAWEISSSFEWSSCLASGVSTKLGSEIMGTCRQSGGKQ
jgi:hypothetical protein